MAVGQFIFTEVGGSYSVNAINTGISVSLKNLGYIGNAAPAVNVPSGSKVSPSGHIGTAGASGSTPALNDISPTTTRGDVIVDNGANNPLASDVRLAAGSDGTVFTSDSAQPTGRKQVAITPNAATDNVLPRFDASGNTTPTPLKSSGVRITNNGAVQETGGNAKGADAVDLQPVRGVVTQVASGANATISGGKNSTASGIESAVSGGNTNVASGDDSVVSGGILNTASGFASNIDGGSSNLASSDQAVVGGGVGNTASGINSTVGGGSTNVASGTYATVGGGFANQPSAEGATVGGGEGNQASASGSTVPGGFQGNAYLYGQVAHGSNKFAAVGDAQTSELIWRRTTTDATANLEMFLDGSSATQRAVVPNNHTWAFEIICCARRSDGMSICFKVDGGIKNDAGVVVLVAANTTIVTADGTAAALGAANFVVAADDPNNSLKLSVTGQGGQTWRWVARARLVECGH